MAFWGWDQVGLGRLWEACFLLIPYIFWFLLEGDMLRSGGRCEGGDMDLRHGWVLIILYITTNILIILNITTNILIIHDITTNRRVACLICRQCNIQR